MVERRRPRALLGFGFTNGGSMSRPTPRLLLGLACCAALVACTVSLSFDFDQANVAVQFAGSSVNTTVPIDLSTQSDIQAHKGNIQSISLNSADVTVTAVNAGNSATAISGTVVLRPDGATDASHDVTVGTLSNFSIATGSTVHLVGSPALDALVLSTVKGSGKATALISGTSVGSTGNFVLDLKLHLSMDYGT
jgi:hypothetical protein